MNEKNTDNQTTGKSSNFNNSYEKNRVETEGKTQAPHSKNERQQGQKGSNDYSSSERTPNKNDRS